MHSRARGGKSEQTAVDFLVKKGFDIIERNYYCDYGEIDIIAKDGDELVFVEVKSVDSDSGINIFETLSNRKLSRLEKAINTWLLEQEQLLAKWRFDFVGIELGKEEGQEKIHHLASAQL